MSQTPTPSTGQLATVTYLSGVNDDASVSTLGTIAAQSFADWNGQDPAGYDATTGFAHTWDDNSAGRDVARTAAAGTGGGTVTYGFGPADTAAQQQAFIADLTLWSDEANISFAAATSAATADLLFDVTSSGGTSNTTAPQRYSVAGSRQIPAELTPSQPGGGQDVITFDNDGTYGTIGSFTATGGYGIDALTHEIGHMLGLGHSGPYNDGDTINPDSVQQSAFDSRQWSVMSYIQPDDTAAQDYGGYTVTGTQWKSSTTTQPGGGTLTMAAEVAPQTPMMLDVLAAQVLYGAATGGGLQGGQTFGFNCTVADASRPFFDFTQNVTPVVTLWDAGRGNTLDLSGYSTGAVVNLTPGSFSSAGGLTNNIGIAFATAIDAAIGGSGNDTFTPNGDGDTITGGGGTDTVVYGDASSDYSLATSALSTIVTRLATGTQDTLYGISTVTFADQSVNVACYCAGTRIATPHGEVAVEALAIGDPVLTAGGAIRPVRWVGHRSYAARFVAANPAIRPIRLRAGCLGGGLPRRDLLVSPQHAMLLDGVLIAARLLVNGTTVVREPLGGPVRYLHIELETHDAILAEGAASETFVDDGGRGMFHNASTHAALYPGPALPALYCAPRVERGPLLEAIYRRVQADAVKTLLTSSR